MKKLGEGININLYKTKTLGFHPNTPTILRTKYKVAVNKPSLKGKVSRSDGRVSLLPWGEGGTAIAVTNEG